MSFTFKPATEEHLESISWKMANNQLDYHEYKFLESDQLRDYFLSGSSNMLNKQNAVSLVIFQKEELIGYLNCTLDEFDSTMFEFPCYRINNLIILSDDPQEIPEIISHIIKELEEILSCKNQKIYVALSLNNNIQHVDSVFNSLVHSGFYYIHTLLTFSSIKKKFVAESYYPQHDLRIRKAGMEDVKGVHEIAESSFRYSRFHLDPFLDDHKASQLLGTSAANSIVEQYVDVMFVAEIKGKIAGYYSAKKKYLSEFGRTIGNVVISAVDESSRGMGLFSKMDSHILNWFAENSDFAEMGTYLGNYPVHKTWINKGLPLIRGTHQFSKLITR